MVWAGLVLFGSPLVPVGLGVLAHAANAARIRSWLFPFTVLGLLASAGAVWALLAMNDTTSPLNVPVYVAAVVVSGLAVGALASSFWRTANWIGRFGVYVGVVAFVVVVAAFNTIWVLYLGGDR
jgi:hypothetical protein